jgi:hypothetical protein
VKRLLIAVVGLVASVGVASPVAAGYPPGSPTVESSSATPAPNAPITITVSDFCPSTDFAVDIDGTTVATGSTDASGAASVSITAPGTVGTYTVTVTAGGECSDVASLSIEVTAGGGLPGTGSNSTMPGLQIGIIAVLLGGALVGLASMRRRATAAR